MPVTLNALRKFLNSSGCIESRVLHDPGSAIIFIEFRCVRGTGKSCRSVVTVDRQAPHVATRVLKKIGKDLAPCLGRGWEARIPQEDPFG
jgi:hypothetical protein